jgi:hypothetical protein
MKSPAGTLSVTGGDNRGRNIVAPAPKGGLRRQTPLFALDDCLLGISAPPTEGRENATGTRMARKAASLTRTAPLAVDDGASIAVEFTLISPQGSLPCSDMEPILRS